MKNTSGLTTYKDIPGMIELTDEDLTKITAGNGFDTFNDDTPYNDSRGPNRNRRNRNRRNRNRNR